MCETCGYWAVVFESVIDGHHPNCPKLGEASPLIQISWADEHGTVDLVITKDFEMPTGYPFVVASEQPTLDELLMLHKEKLLNRGPFPK